MTVLQGLLVPGLSLALVTILGRLALAQGNTRAFSLRSNSELAQLCSLSVSCQQSGADVRSKGSGCLGVYLLSCTAAQVELPCVCLGCRRGA